MSDAEATLPDPQSDPGSGWIGFAKWQKLLIVAATLICLFLILAVVVRLGMAIHHTLLLFSLGGLVAYALDPLVELLRKPKFGKSQKPMGRTFSVLLVFLAMILLFLGGIWWLGGQAAHQFKTLQQDAPAYKQRAQDLAKQVDDQFLKPRNVDFSAEDTIANPPKDVSAYAEQASKKAIPLLAHAASNLAESVVVLLIALYFLIFATDMKEQANRSLNSHLRLYAERWEEDVNRILGGFVRGQVVVAVITGAAAAVGLLLIGVHLWLIIGLFVVACSLIPVFGPYIGAIPALIAALVGPTHFTPIVGAIIVFVMFVVINEFASKILYPKLVGQALNLHEVVVLFVLFAGLEIDGIIGTLFAAPLTALAIVTTIHLYRLWQDLPENSISDELQTEAASKGANRLFKKSK